MQYESLAKDLTASHKAASLPEGLFYMKQTVSNACGTVAMLHAVANNRDKVEVEGVLKAFLDEAAGKSADERAKMLEESDAICSVHDQVAKEGQTSAPSIDDKVDYHFIAFVEKAGKLYELDGRKEAPICFGEIGDKGFLQVQCSPDLTNSVLTSERPSLVSFSAQSAR